MREIPQRRHKQVVPGGHTRDVIDVQGWAG